MSKEKKNHSMAFCCILNKLFMVCKALAPLYLPGFSTSPYSTFHFPQNTPATWAFLTCSYVC